MPVADLTHDFADDGFHEIHLSGKQLVFLFMATTVVAVVIFLCGVQVGRSVPTQRTQESFADPTLAASAQTLPPPVAAAGPPAAEPPVPPAETDELSYKKRLEGEATAKESLKPAAEAPARTAPPATARSQPAPAPAPPAAAVPAPQTTATTGTAQPGTWVLQVHALRDAKVANGIVQRLSRKGYPAFLVASNGPTSMYRVFVGRYKDRSEAERVAERLKKEEQFNPWITR
jgi:cell division septation protein DedD